MSSAPDPETAPRRLDRYRLYDEIGTGGMARVHLGKLVGAAGFARVVAIKRLHPHLVAEPSARAMLVDEARLSSRVHDPHVVRVLDVIDHEGAVALVMEYVLGEALSRVLSESRDPIPIPVAVALAVDTLQGLHAAHEARGADGRPLSIVHRDVSPHNVIVGIDGRARVIDFGIAKATNRLARTQSGVTKGKHGYMAPEQLLGQPVSRQADVYSAGIVVWEMLVGAPLFHGGDGEGIAVRVAQSVTTAPGDQRDGVPRALDAAVLRALSLRPQDRPPTALAFAEALAAAVPPAPRSVVARWLEAVCGDALDLAQERLARVESAPEEEGDGREVVPLPPVEDVVPASAPRAVAALASGGAPRRRVGMWAAMALGLVAVGALVAMAATRAPAATQGAAEPSPFVGAADPAAEVAEAAPDTVPSGLAAPSTPEPAASPRVASPKRSGAKGKPAARPNCTPPYTFDEAGRKIFKPQCF